jgi:hypothetical protein
MARMRMLKPEFFRDKKVRQLTPTAALVFQALWCLADDGGVAPADPERVFGELFIGWEHITLQSVTGALRELSGSGRVVLYVVGDDAFAMIPSWGKHQKPSHPSQFRYPRPAQGVTEKAPGALPEPSGSPPPQLSVSQVSVISSQVEGEAVSSSSSTTARERLPDDYRPDYDALRRASHSPETLDREVLALTSGRHPTIDHLTPEDVGVGMRELVLAGAPQSKLSRFAQVARDQRLHPRPSGGHFRAGHDDDEAARQRLLAKYPEEARAT